MSKLKRIVRNISITFLSNNLLKVLSTVLVILIARYLGDVEYGKFSFAISFTGLFLILMDLGTRISIVRDIAQNRKEASKIVANTLMLKFVSSFIVYFIILGLAFALSYSRETIIAIAIAAAGLIFESLSITVSSIFQAFENLEISAVTKLARILLRFIFTIPLLINGSSFLLVLVVYAIVQFIDFAISLAICYKSFVKLSFEFDKKLMITIAKKAFPFLLSGIFVTVYFRVDITLMSKLAPTSLQGFYDTVSREAIIGWYSSAYNLLDAVAALAAAVSVSILPVAIIFFKESSEKLVRLYSTSVRFLIYIALPLAVGTTLLADKIILLIYGQNYSNATLALKILIWAIIPLFINYMMGAILIAIHQEKKGVIILFLNVFVNVGLNIFLIPKYSLYGAAAATFLTEIFYFCGYYLITSKYFKPLNLVQIIFKPLIASVAMGLVVYYLLNLNLFILIFLGVIIYSGSMILFKAITQEDKELINRVFVKKEF